VSPLAQDSLLGDRYRLTRRLAVGGMGEVWRAEDGVLHRTVAVKVLKSEFTSDPTFLERFRTEARTTASLSHPGIANVFDYGELNLDRGSDDLCAAYLVMEYVDGEPLSAQLAREGRLPVDRVLDVVRQAALALAEAHRVGMVHRDVKPGNLLIRRRDGVVKITDFGIARAADAVPLTQSGMVVGTAQYFSPEQAEGRVVGPASDVYSLGVVAYECLAGRLPFVADSPVAVAMMQIREVPPPLPPDVPAPVRALVLRALAKDPRQRFADGGELAEAVRAVQEGRYDGGPVLVRSPDGVGGTNPGLPYPPMPGSAPAPGGPGSAPGAPASRAPTPAAPGSTPIAPGSASRAPAPAPGASWAAVPASFPPPAAPFPGTGGAHAAPPAGADVSHPADAGPGPAFAAPGPAADSSGPHVHPGPAAFTGGPVGPSDRGAAPAGGAYAAGPAAPSSRLRRAPRWPFWIAAALLLALAVAGVATVLTSRGGGDDRGTISRSAATPSGPAPTDRS
jgi:serine/threonine-protein kinase